MGIDQDEISTETTTLGELLVAENIGSRHRKVVKALYKALALKDTSTTSKLVAPDLEWWFHGPRHCQHMMRTLTGESRHVEFKFRPRSITPVGDRVVAEGWEGSKAYWAHVWSVKEGMITQLREYFNTWVTVIVGNSEVEDEMMKLWQSDPRERSQRSLPDIVLAI
ncbi:hypothetical protein PRUPE_6G046300 [Prunus persica]|uniref:Wound-induced protein 1 n=1 Tax=Prunus persica TaxID=3760 RepID=A0A251NK83_PRUPE|nr:wound-induced protein 1 [Prunus persica]ONH99730.1 hypothetical protein PRUPE_6G046300 [Prunus persica]